MPPPLHTTTLSDEEKTQAFLEGGLPLPADSLIDRYQGLLRSRRVQWTTYHRFQRELGSGGQGVVYLSERNGADGFNQPVAMKIFSPERFPTSSSYKKAMERVARVASRVATIQHDNLLDVQDFVDRDRIRIMVMEWIDGYDLRQLMNPDRLTLVRKLAGQERWEHINSVIVTFGPEQTRFKAGVAIAIVRDCLAALAALHRQRIVHGDIKPANIMLKRTGNAKLIDMGSAFELDDPPPNRACTPAYAAPEVLEGASCTPRSDLASLGYVLIEMLSGRSCVPSDMNLRDLLEMKRRLPQRLHELLPPEVACNSHLMNLCKRFIATDPLRRFPSAEAAELLEDGAAQFHRQLVFGDLASEYEHDLHLWLEQIRKIDELHNDSGPDSTLSGSHGQADNE
ncbi:MAG: serine/threonine protein kinase [Planctomycetales bacterium]|nr:serine/threonine protein kinase [Planctomycetales bacterium]